VATTKEERILLYHNQLIKEGKTILCLNLVDAKRRRRGLIYLEVIKGGEAGGAGGGSGGRR